VKVVGFGFLEVILWIFPKAFSSLLISSSEVASEFEEHVSTVTISLFITFIVEGYPFTLFNSFNI
jgi:hypothetical protein